MRTVVECVKNQEFGKTKESTEN